MFQRKDAYDTIPRAQSELSLREPRDEQAVGSDGSSTASSSATLALQESQAEDKVKEEGQGRNRPLSLVQEESESHLMFSAGGDRSPVSSQSKDEKGQMQSRDKKPSSSFKRNSMVQLGRVKGMDSSIIWT